MERVFKTTSPKEKNEFIAKCYKENIKYSYSKKDKSGEYVIKYDAD